MNAEGTLDWEPADTDAGRALLAPPVVAALAAVTGGGPGAVPGARVAAIDPTLADTAAFCEAYQSDPAFSANCVIVAGKRSGEVRYAAVLVLASDRADINGVVRRHLDVRKISFAPMDEATSLTQMEFGGITPVGLPAGWPILIDPSVVAAGTVVIGSGIRASKLLVPSAELLDLPGAEQVSLGSAKS